MFSFSAIDHELEMLRAMAAKLEAIRVAIIDDDMADIARKMLAGAPFFGKNRIWYKMRAAKFLLDNNLPSIDPNKAAVLCAPPRTPIPSLLLSLSPISTAQLNCL